jgi:diguanylate cyclase (GGDEF)-like protein
MTGKTKRKVEGNRDALLALQRDMLVSIALGETAPEVITAFCRSVERLMSDVCCAVVGIDAEQGVTFVSAPSLPETLARAGHAKCMVDAVKRSPQGGKKSGDEVLHFSGDAQLSNFGAAATQHGFLAFSSWPITAQDGRVLGCFSFFFRERRGPSALEHAAAQECVGICAMAIENTEARTTLSNLAFFDALTGLGNRVTLKNRLGVVLQRASEARNYVALFHIDIRDFRAVNDLHGRAVGDKALLQVAQKLRALAWDCDLIIRMGGDEFLVVKTVASDPHSFQDFARVLSEGLRERFEVDNDVHVSIGVHIGVAKFPRDGLEQDELIANAESALHNAQETGAEYAVFDPNVRLAQRRRRAMEHDVGLAVERQQLSVVYQPQIDTKTSHVRAFEALVRWEHPEHGIISPADFIPLAETNGAIVGIGKFVLKQACTAAATWSDRLRVAVNVSPAQIVQRDFVEEVVRVLEETGLEADRLEIEVTESLFIQDSESASTVLRELKSLGISVALDDFGTGYSSLSTLRSFPFDRLKVDRSFVKDMLTSSDAAAIVNSVIGLGRALGLRVVAEGVERDEHVIMLRSSGCHEVQGYLFGKPLPPEEYSHLMKPSCPVRRRPGALNVTAPVLERSSDVDAGSKAL